MTDINIIVGEGHGHHGHHPHLHDHDCPHHDPQEVVPFEKEDDDLPPEEAGDDSRTRELIAQEERASNDYEQLADEANDEDTKEVYEDISDEEKVHAGELLVLLLKQDPKQKKALEEGSEEVRELVGGESFKEMFAKGRDRVVAKANGASIVKAEKRNRNGRDIDITSDDIPGHRQFVDETNKELVVEKPDQDFSKQPKRRPNLSRDKAATDSYAVEPPRPELRQEPKSSEQTADAQKILTSDDSTEETAGLYSEDADKYLELYKKPTPEMIAAREARQKAAQEKAAERKRREEEAKAARAGQPQVPMLEQMKNVPRPEPRSYEEQMLMKDVNRMSLRDMFHHLGYAYRDLDDEPGDKQNQDSIGEGGD